MGFYLHKNVLMAERKMTSYTVEEVGPSNKEAGPERLVISLNQLFFGLSSEHFCEIKTPTSDCFTQNCSF